MHRFGVILLMSSAVASAQNRDASSPARAPSKIEMAGSIPGFATTSGIIVAPARPGLGGIWQPGCATSGQTTVLRDRIEKQTKYISSLEAKLRSLGVKL